jgi:hypothetical protein
MGQSTYTPEVGNVICGHLADGKSLKAVCRMGGMPPASTVLNWLKDENLAAFADQYTRAREIGYQLLSDEIIEISDDGKGDSWTDDDGVEHTDNERVARSKLRVDSRKWMLSKMLPKVYGEKIEQKHIGDPTLPVQIILNGSDVHG